MCFDRRMDPGAVRDAFDEQVRRHPAVVAAGEHVEREDRVVRVISDSDGWAGVTWSDLDKASADGVIASQIERFAEFARMGVEALLIRSACRPHRPALRRRVRG